MGLQDCFHIKRGKTSNGMNHNTSRACASEDVFVYCLVRHQMPVTLEDPSLRYVNRGIDVVQGLPSGGLLDASSYFRHRRLSCQCYSCHHGWAGCRGYQHRSVSNDHVSETLKILDLESRERYIRWFLTGRRGLRISLYQMLS